MDHMMVAAAEMAVAVGAAAAAAVMAVGECGRTDPEVVAEV